MTLEEFWEEHNSKLNTIIGKLSVPAMQTNLPLVKECHRELIDFAGWVDDSLESVSESEE
jgi:hypothetical protein